MKQLLSEAVFVEKVNSFFDNNGVNILKAILILLLGIIAIRAVLKAVKSGLVRSKLDTSLHSFIFSAVKILLYTLLIIACADKLGIQSSSLVTLLGACGLAVSLSLQNILGDVFSGIIIFASKPFEQGDYVSIESVSGTVIEIGIVYTKLRAVDGKTVRIPNSDVMSTKIVNYNDGKGRRLDESFTISYSDSIDNARAAILDEVSKLYGVIDNPSPQVVAAELADSGVRLEARVWVKNSEYVDFRFALIENVKKRFDKEGITIPYTTLAVIKDTSDEGIK